jgi:hypothetical protein
MRASTQVRIAILLIEQYFVINMVLSCFTARRGRIVWLRSRPIVKTIACHGFWVTMFNVENRNTIIGKNYASFF